MLNKVVSQMKTGLLVLLFLTVITGILYPLLITTIAQSFFPWRANGSLLTVNNQTIGSLLIGQSFNDPAYFWGRPSATNPFPYNARQSSGSNLGPSNPYLFSVVQNRVTRFLLIDPTQRRGIPVDLVTASASGLDPEISPLAAYYQIPRIAKARGISEDQLTALVKRYTQSRTWNLLGEPRVNVLKLNLALMHFTNHPQGQP